VVARAIAPVAAAVVLIAVARIAAVAAAAEPAVAIVSAAEPAPAPPASTVVLISIDGLRHDHPGLAGAPNLRRMTREGASAARLLASFPASTFPAHATLATGVHADRHGIVNNEFFDRERGRFERADDAAWLLSEPIWAAAERAGVRTGVFHWVFSYTPWNGVAATRRVPFERGTRDRDKADTVRGWILERGDDRPRLILTYWHGPDAAGHEHGPTAPETIDRVRATDAFLGRILAAARERPGTAVIVVSDHGMAPVDRVLRFDRILAGPGARALAIATGATANLYCPDEAACESAAAALRAIPGVTVHTPASLPPAWRYMAPGRTGDLVAVAPRGAYFAEGPGTRPPARGMHGYAPDDPDMAGVFIGWGSGFRRGARRDALRAVDVAPTICRLLAFRCPEGLDGAAPVDMLEAGREERAAAEKGGRRSVVLAGLRIGRFPGPGRAARHPHAGGAQGPFSQAVAAFQLFDHGVVARRVVDRLGGDRLGDGRVERLADGLDRRHPFAGERLQQVIADDQDPLQEGIGTGAGPGGRQRPVEIVQDADHLAQQFAARDVEPPVEIAVQTFAERVAVLLHADIGGGDLAQPAFRLPGFRPQLLDGGRRRHVGGGDGRRAARRRCPGLRRGSGRVIVRRPPAVHDLEGGIPAAILVRHRGHAPVHVNARSTGGSARGSAGGC
jgi:predicted AlkP superfamily pyrophosphatase or phosphodiesterase